MTPEEIEFFERLGERSAQPVRHGPARGAVDRLTAAIGAPVNDRFAKAALITPDEKQALADDILDYAARLRKEFGI